MVFLLLTLLSGAAGLHGASQAPGVLPGLTRLVGREPDVQFVRCLAAAGDVNGDGFHDLLVSSPAANDNRGRVELFLGSPTGLQMTPAWTLPGEQPGHYLGQNVAGVGDVNGDGRADLVVSWVASDEEGKSGTWLELFYGGHPEPRPSGWRYWQASQGFYLGARAGRAGDVNGDGLDDFFVGGSMVRHPPDPGVSGQVLVFHGARGGPRTAPDWTASSGFAADGFGASVAGAGDVNRDGFADLVVGAPLDDQAGLDSGRVYVYYGSKSGLAGSPGWVRHLPLTIRDRFSSDLQAFFGCSVASAGDVNGDGFADVVAGANFAEVDDVNEGVAFVFLGSRSGLQAEPHWIGQPNERFAAYGSSVAGLGDIDGDGFGDLLVGAPQASDDQQFEGLAALYRGSRRGLSAEPDWTAEADRTDDYLGEFVVAVGDVNGDGFADAAMAVPGYRDDRGRVGQVWIKYGSPQGFSGSSNWRLSKPWPVAWQQRWDRAEPGERLAWSGAGGVLALGAVGLAWGWHRRRMRHAAAASHRQARREAARDLHDEAGPPLAALGASLVNTGHPAALQEAQAQADELGEVLDRLTRQWKAEGPDLGLAVDALLSSARRLAEAGGLEVQTEIGELPTGAALPADGERHLSACLKEAVANVLRHAHARRVVLRAIPKTPDRLQLEVEDDGRGGADVSASPGHDGLGNLVARMKELGGRCEIASEPERGTLVVLEVPTVPARSRAGSLDTPPRSR